MAYLSGVTHDKLVGKYTPSAEGLGGQHMTIAYGGDDVVEPVDLGLKNCGSFEANVRCCASFETGGSIRGLHCWTGESDGTVTVRQAWTGETVTVLDKKQGVFVSSLKFINGTMYAGLSDGCLRAYRVIPNPEADELDYTLVAEAKKHLGEITCIENVGDNAVTGGRDWQVFVWRWEDQQLKVCDQWLGHKLPVRALAYSEGYLFTGGDDAWVRCVSMSSGIEKVHDNNAGFPIKTNGSVRALCAFGPVLFTGDEENLNVYDSVNGEHLALLLQSEGAILTLMKDPAGRRIWSGGVDGVVRLWDADPRSGFKMLTAINDHNGTAVRMLVPLARVTACKAWTVDRDGRLKLWYSESDCSEFENEQNAEEERITQSVHDLRMVLNQNAANLDALKRELEKFETLEKGRKRQLVAVFARSAEARTLRRCWHKLFNMRERYNRMRKLTALSLSLRAASQHEIRTTYYGALLKHARWSRQLRMKRKFAATLLASTTRTLALLYYAKLKEYAQMLHKREARAGLCHTLSALSTNTLRRGTFLRWGRWVVDQKQRRKRRGVSHVLFRHTRLGLLFIYYGKLVAYWKNIREAHRKGTLSNSLLCTLHKTMRYTYYAKWYRWYSGRKNKSRTDRVVKVLTASSRLGLYRVYFLKLSEWRVISARKRLEDEHNAMVETVRKLEEKLAESKQVTESGLRKEIDGLEQESARLDKDIADLEREVADLDEEQQMLETKAMGYTVNPGAPIAEKVYSVCSFLKAHGVSCRYDIKDITEAAKSHDRGVATFTAGISQTQKILVQYSKGGDKQMWWPEDLYGIRELPEHARAAVHRGVKEIIIGVDQMRYYKTPFPEADCEKFLDNIPVIFEVVRVTYDKRIGKENVAVEAWEASRAADPYASRHGKLTHTREEIDELQGDYVVPEGNGPDGGRSPSPHGSLRRGGSSPQAVPKKPPSGKGSSTKRSPPVAPVTKSKSPNPPARAQRAGASVSPNRPLPPVQGDNDATAEQHAAEYRAVDDVLPPTAEPVKVRRAAPGFKVSTALVVSEVTSRAACASGLQEGDVITAINLQDIRDKPEYIALLKKVPPNTAVAVSYIRGGATRTVEVVMGEM